MAYYDNLKLEKGMYQTAGKSFTEVLELLDPSNTYANTENAGLDAFQRQLKRFDIKVSGSSSDVVEKFFKTSDSATLFPEYIARAVRTGMAEGDLLPKIVATVTRINHLDYRSITTDPADDRDMKKVATTAHIPSTTIRMKNNLVNLVKHGRMLVSSYEAVRFQPIDLFTVTLRQIGSNIAKSLLTDAVSVLLNGDGNNNSAEVISSSVAGTLSYSDLINLWSKFDPYDMNTLLVSAEGMKKLLSLDEFKNPLTGLNFQATGTLSSPLGAELVRSSAVAANTVIGLDKNCALEMVQASDVTIDFDKLIDRQLERTAITTIAGFAKIFSGAAKALSI